MQVRVAGFRERTAASAVASAMFRGRTARRREDASFPPESKSHDTEQASHLYRLRTSRGSRLAWCLVLFQSEWRDAASLSKHIIKQCFCVSMPTRHLFAICRSYLFTLVNTQGVAATKFDVTKSKYATIHHPEWVTSPQCCVSCLHGNRVLPTNRAANLCIVPACFAVMDPCLARVQICALRVIVAVGCSVTRTSRTATTASTPPAHSSWANTISTLPTMRFSRWKKLPDITKVGTNPGFIA